MEFTDKDYHGVISQTLKADNNAGLANVLISPIVQDEGPLRFKKSYIFLVALAITMSLASLLFAGNAITLFLKHGKSNTAINYLGIAIGLFILVIFAFIVLHSMDGEYYTEDSIWHVHNYSDEYVKRKYPLLKDDQLFKNVKDLGRLIDVLRFAYIVHQEQEADALLKKQSKFMASVELFNQIVSKVNDPEDIDNFKKLVDTLNVQTPKVTEILFEQICKKPCEEIINNALKSQRVDDLRLIPGSVYRDYINKKIDYTIQ